MDRERFCLAGKSSECGVTKERVKPDHHISTSLILLAIIATPPIAKIPETVILSTLREGARVKEEDEVGEEGVPKTNLIIKAVSHLVANHCTQGAEVDGIIRLERVKSSCVMEPNLEVEEGGLKDGGRKDNLI
jgi:hypothetical protein